MVNKSKTEKKTRPTAGELTTRVVQLRAALESIRDRCPEKSTATFAGEVLKLDDEQSLWPTRNEFSPATSRWFDGEVSSLFKRLKDKLADEAGLET